MSRSPSRFRQRDLTAALRAAQAAGLTVQRVEVDGGRIVLVTGEAVPTAPTAGQSHDLDKELSDWEARRDR